MPSLDFDLEESHFRAFYAQQSAALEAACAALTGMVAAVVTRAGGVDIAKVEGRVKEVDECIRKFVRKYRPSLEEGNTAYEIQGYITDLVGVRVVCLYEDELEKIAQIVRSHFAVIDVTDKVTAVESTEASFGYKGLHLDLKLSTAERGLPEHAAYAHLPFELQVRTIIQDSWSVLDHRIKYKKSIPGQLKRRINVLSALFELADREFRQIRDATAAELLQAPDETEEPLADAAPDDSNPQAPSKTPAPSSELNAFTFLKIATHFFKDFEFEPSKVDGFVDDIQVWSPGMTRARFNALMRETVGVVKRYKQHFEEQNPQASFNPYTVIRHCLYLSNKAAFRPALRNSARESFEAWLQDHAEPRPQ
ncbi:MULTISPECIES: GTP pyrophosphokinase family protein [unclassified Acidovorax]|uniref:GTP pyrophosphokinase n=1 Tax=unclassified Acidovorax TaxID=2684926 RepID=UPI001C467A58|nr:MULTISPECIES: RelA/SpoT domain-containing protein [unclassified Acidovorax]MBV7426649.1 RelA/SpoT domain-containing protein [Acidovorax sp. sif0732]MBV7447774.1 RelA/SpoT domain-containing protein [Acidovorax sp. sif0715]